MGRLACVLAWTGRAGAAGGADWMTNGDAQRSAWVRADAKISKESLSQDPKGKADFQLLWKLKLNNKPRQLNSLRRRRRSNV